MIDALTAYTYDFAAQNIAFEVGGPGDPVIKASQLEKDALQFLQNRHADPNYTCLLTPYHYKVLEKSAQLEQIYSNPGELNKILDSAIKDKRIKERATHIEGTIDFI